MIAKVLSCKRIAQKGSIASNGYRTPQVCMLLGQDSWVEHVDNGIRYVQALVTRSFRGRWNGWEALPNFILIYQLVETFDFTFRHLFPDTRMTSPNACFRQETSPKNFEYLVFIVKVKLWWTSMQVGCETTQ